jgi:hypothetical protein
MTVANARAACATSGKTTSRSSSLFLSVVKSVAGITTPCQYGIARPTRSSSDVNTGARGFMYSEKARNCANVGSRLLCRLGQGWG